MQAGRFLARVIGGQHAEASEDHESDDEQDDESDDDSNGVNALDS